MSRQSYLSSSPATRHYAITPADAPLGFEIRALYVAVGGDLVIRDWEGVDVTYPVIAGQVFPFSARQVRSGTTATVVGWQ